MNQKKEKQKPKVEVTEKPKPKKPEKKPSTVKLYRVNHPLYVGERLSEHIKKYVRKLGIPSITYESLYAYFTYTSQYAENLLPKGYTPPIEFTVACDIESGEPLGFAHWIVAGRPHIGATIFDHLHIWESRKGDVAEAFIGRWAAFARKHNCVIFLGSCIDETVFRKMKMIATKKGYEFIESGQKGFYAFKKKES